MKNLKTWLRSKTPTFEKDKLLNFIAGALIGLLANAFVIYQFALLTVLLAAVATLQGMGVTLYLNV